MVIFYTFVSLQYNPAIHESIEEWALSVFQQASIMLILFVAVFIGYSNSFFTKKRKKEVGLYSLLGVRKRTIGTMLFYENLLMGTVAVIVGILLGALLSKLFAMILLKLLDSAIDVSFSFSLKAVLETVVIFGIMIIFTSIQAYRLIYRFKLIELFQAEKEGEQAPKASIFVAGIAIVLIGLSYWILHQPMKTNSDRLIILGLFLTCIIMGTYLLFRSLTVSLLKTAQKNRSHYYKGMNLVGTSQLLYRIKGNARTLAMIALLSTVTLCAISVGYTSYYNVDKSVNVSYPFSFTFISQGKSFDNQVEQIISSDKNHQVTAHLDIPVIQVSGDISDINYAPPGYTTKAFPVEILSLNMFNQIAKTLNREATLQLSGNQVAAIHPMNTALNESDFIGQKVSLDLPQGSQKVTFVKFFEEKVINSGFPDFFVVVSDTIYNEAAKQATPMIYKAYKVKDQGTTKATSERLKQMDSEAIKMTSFYQKHKEGVEIAGMDIFLLGFLGLVFLTATGSIIFLKQLSEAHADKELYQILRKIGISKRDVLSTVSKQTLFVFILPFVIGVLHCIMIIQALFGINLAEGTLIPILVTIAAYISIYFGYYVLTVNTYNKIVNR